ncbi:endonuclease-reverse transcriptase, partial [Danaus plexippus plexippus]
MSVYMRGPKGLIKASSFTALQIDQTSTL